MAPLKVLLGSFGVPDLTPHLNKEEEGKGPSLDQRQMACYDQLSPTFDAPAWN